MVDTSQPSPPSSRTGAHHAWDDAQRKPYNTHWERLLAHRVHPRWTNFSWVSPATLLDSINDQLEKGIRDLVDARRMRWVMKRREMRAAAGIVDDGYEWRLPPPPGLGESFSFALVGDPGEQDASQYAVVCPLVSKARELSCRFMVTLSDVIYPAGNVNEYVDGFYRPYEHFPGPIYGVPGNHDWYDGLEGFMFHFCGADPPSSPRYRPDSFSLRERIARGLWRRSARPQRAELYRWAKRRSGPGDGPRQPGPYWAMDTGRLVLVAIDTGVTGDLDPEQGDWLLSVARSSMKPKVLLTGKPIYANGEYHRGEIRWGQDTASELKSRPESVDAIVRAADHNFVAVIGGDIHNYQHYRVRICDVPEGCEAPPGSARERQIHYIVSGGGGAYLSATHRIGAVAMTQAGTAGLPPGVGPVSESDFCCYPLRGDSLAQFTRNFGRWLGVVWAVLWTAAIVTGGLAAFGLFPEVKAVREALNDDWIWLVVSAPALVALVLLVIGVPMLPKSTLPRPVPEIIRVAAMVAGGALLVLLAHWIFAPWDWLWKMAAVTAVLVLGPILLIVTNYLARGRLPRRFAESLLAGGALAYGVAQFEPASLVEIALTVLVVSLLLAGTLIALWALSIHAKRWYPRVLAAVYGGLAVLAVVLYWERWPAQAAVLALVGLVVGLALVLLVLTWPVAFAFPVFIKANMDPDKACALVAEKRGIPRERGSVAPDRTTRWLGQLLLGRPGRILNRIVSEFSEATTPPFFKSFLTFTVADDLRIDCWGVSGYASQETKPTLEHSVRIALPANPAPVEETP